MYEVSKAQKGITEPIDSHQAALSAAEGSTLAAPTQRVTTPMAVAIVNYNTREHLHACLASVQPEAPGEVVVVDNASTDGSVEMVQAAYPGVILLANNWNPGYGAAANQAITRCASRYVLLLNSDTRLQPGALQALSAYLDRRPQAAIVGPRLVNPDGTLQVSSFPFPTPLVTLLSGTSLGMLIHYVPILREHYLPAWPHTRARIVPWVLGAALAIRRDVFAAVNGFDDSFFMYAEEVDLCYRLRAAGWQIHFAPVTTIVHVGGASTRHCPADMEIQRYASTRHFYQRHYTNWWRLQLQLFVTYAMFRNMVRDSIRWRRASQDDRRAQLREQLVVWQRVLGDTWREQPSHHHATCSPETTMSSHGRGAPQNE